MNQDRALACIPVWGAIRFLADNIAAMAPGLGLYKLGSGDIAVRQPTPSLFANPSIHGTLFDWLHKAVISMGLQGDGIGLITQRDFYGWPTAVEWLNPINVQTLDRAIEGPGSYIDPRWYWWGRPMDPRDLLHIPWFCLPWRVRGLTPIGAYAQMAGIGLSAQSYALGWFDNGGVPPGTFRNTAQKVLPDDADEIMGRLSRRLRTRQPLVYGSDWEYTAIAIKPNEAQFLETTRLTATQIAVIYGIPPEQIGGELANNLTYSTVEQNTLNTLTYTFRPWLTRFEYAFSTCFPRGYFVRFNTDEFLRVDAKTRAEIDALSLGTTQLGWKDRNEVRVGYNLPPQKDPVPAQPATPQAPRSPEPARRPAASSNGSGPTPGSSAANGVQGVSGVRMMRDRVPQNGALKGK
jgi:HK97 family phage portal protein